MEKPEIKIEPWSYSAQRGTPGHCMMAQVFQGDMDGHSICAIEPEENPDIATNTAKAISAVPDMIDALIEAKERLEYIKEYSASIYISSLCGKELDKIEQALKKAGCK